ncbi:hypothetical protein BJV78DRAFT_196247 [Lactifluus subvellereus]|nr:hypothetical protein BJV78DRAFT_196247 [Lactifluus subvellereus]
MITTKDPDVSQHVVVFPLLSSESGASTPLLQRLGPLTSLCSSSSAQPTLLCHVPLCSTLNPLLDSRCPCKTCGRR